MYNICKVGPRLTTFILPDENTMPHAHASPIAYRLGFRPPRPYRLIRPVWLYRTTASELPASVGLPLLLFIRAPGSPYVVFFCNIP